MATGEPKMKHIQTVDKYSHRIVNILMLAGGVAFYLLLGLCYLLQLSGYR